MEEVIKTVISFAEECLRNTDSIHGIKHARMTAEFAGMLADKERAEKELCIIAGWLHDIGRTKEWIKETPESNHGTRAVDIRDFLISVGMIIEQIDQVCDAIASHCFPGMQKTLVAKILWDADKLRVFSKKEEERLVEHWTRKLGCREEAIKFIKKERQHYSNNFCTKTARKLALNGFQ